jgi:hypothetical protein
MENLKNLLLLFVLGIVFFSISSCSKDYPSGLLNSDSNEYIDPNKRNSTLPMVLNDMLHFDTYSDFDGFMESLEIQEKDSTLAVDAYASLGIDLNNDSIPNLTDHPICLLTEQEIGEYTSLRLVKKVV